MTTISCTQQTFEWLQVPGPDNHVTPLLNTAAPQSKEVGSSWLLFFQLLKI